MATPTADLPVDLVPVQLPDDGVPTHQFCLELQQALHKASWAGVHATARVMPPDLLQRLVQSATATTSKEPTLIEVQPSAQQQRVTVVGDTHGQYHDVCRLFELYGYPSADRIYIFNGDFVDRGAWGVEVLALLMAYKWLLPHNVYLVRGNHESNIITQVYGFAAELKAKYGKASKGLFTHMKRFFASLPLAALIENSTLILHGGLFRAPPSKSKAGAKRRRSTGVKLSVGTLEDLRKASKGGQDPDPDRSLKNLVACDVLWSDPVNEPGIRVNEARGCGTVFGPDVTAEFLAANGLRLIIRSHEGPDARDKRLEGDKMPAVDSGYAEDHVTESGKLVTLFSAPDYPQFIADGDERYHNKAAVLHLSAPDYATPQVESFEAVLPRPQVESYYEVPTYTEDEEDEEAQGTDAGSSQHCTDAGSSQQGSKLGDTAEDTASTATAATAGDGVPSNDAAAGDADAEHMHAAAAVAAADDVPEAAAGTAGASMVQPNPAATVQQAEAAAAAADSGIAAAGAAVCPSREQPLAAVPAPPAAAAAPEQAPPASGDTLPQQQQQQQDQQRHQVGGQLQQLPASEEALSNLQVSTGLPVQPGMPMQPLQPNGNAADGTAAADSSVQPTAAAAVIPAAVLDQPHHQPGVDVSEPTPERPVKRQRMKELTPIGNPGL